MVRFFMFICSLLFGIKCDRVWSWSCLSIWVSHNRDFFYCSLCLLFSYPPQPLLNIYVSMVRSIAEMFFYKPIVFLIKTLFFFNQTKNVHSVEARIKKFPSSKSHASLNENDAKVWSSQNQAVIFQGLRYHGWGTIISLPSQLREF